MFRHSFRVGPGQDYVCPRMVLLHPCSTRVWTMCTTSFTLQVADAVKGVVELGLEDASPVVNHLILVGPRRPPPARSTSDVSN